MEYTPVCVELWEPRMVSYFEELITLCHVNELNGESNNLQARIGNCRASTMNPASIDLLVCDVTDQDYDTLKRLPWVRNAGPFAPDDGPWTTIEQRRKEIEEKNQTSEGQ